MDLIINYYFSFYSVTINRLKFQNMTHIRNSHSCASAMKINTLVLKLKFNKLSFPVLR